jgi:two-component system chemotaxis response regulator CheB
LVQHITPSFLESFVSWLDGLGPLKAVVARDGELPQPGVVHVAPAERHLILKAGRLRLEAGPPVSFQRPSGTTLLESLASELGPRALGLLLTGMGDDGAQGLLELRKAGGYTLSEDESTAVVYGMPGAAAKLGAVCEQLPLGELAPRILELL